MAGSCTRGGRLLNVTSVDDCWADTTTSMRVRGSVKGVINNRVEDRRWDSWIV